MFGCGLDSLEVGNDLCHTDFLELLLDHLAVADDSVQRCAQFVAHTREEPRLGSVGVFGLLLRLPPLRNLLFQSCSCLLFLIEHDLTQSLGLALATASTSG